MTRQENLFIFATAGDLAQGQCDGTEVRPADRGDDGTVVLSEDSQRGVYTSPEVETKPFDYMILSWNAVTPPGSHIEIEGRVRVAGQWSAWLSWGRWSTSPFVNEEGETVLPGSASPARKEDGFASIEPDELKVKGSPEHLADRFQYRLTLHRAPRAAGGESRDAETSPTVSLVACSIKNTAPGQAIPKALAGPDLTHLDKDLDVPAYSQYQQDPKIAHSICSPTSMAMAMGYHGVHVTPEDAAWGVRDQIGRAHV